MTSPVCVLGGAGRTGRRVVDLLLVAGRDVRVVSRRPRRVPAAPGVTTASADITDDSAVRAALDGGGAVVVSVEPPSDGRVSRDDVAAACVAALADPAARGLTFELYGDPSAEPPRWSTVFTTLEPDPTPGTTRTS